MKAAAIATAVVLFALAGDAHAQDRYALVIGANHGEPGEQTLRYAESDAHRLAEVLRTAGQFGAKDVSVLTAVTADQLRRALVDLNTRIRRAPSDTMLLVFYTGHADAASLHLGGSRLPLQEFRDLVAGSPATARLLVIDACQSGALTRLKGGKPAPSFAVKPAQLPITARGLAILASSSGNEDAQESDALRGSFFTHYFISALRGAADENRDGRITLSEAYAYTSERTLVATSESRAGPQHPTYRFDLGGHEELILTQVAASGHLGYLEFDKPGEYFVREADEAGVPVAEIALAKGAVRQVIVPAGRYYISRRSSDHLLQSTFAVQRGASTAVDPERMKRVEYARVVRKGGTTESSAVSVYTVGGVRGSLLGLGTGLHAGLGGRLDTPVLSVELRIHGSQALATNERLTIDTRELGSSAVAVRAFDVGPITLAAGLELGGFWLAQRFGDPQTPDRDTFGALLGPIGIVEWPMGWWYVRGELAALTYMMRVGNDDEMDGPEALFTFRAGLGAGAYF